MSNELPSTLKSTNVKDRLGATKVPLSLIPLSAQIPTALAHFDGALKYQAWNWRSETVAASIYVDAALRHINKWFQGENQDTDSGIHPLGHAIACLNIILDAQAYGNLIDDRPPADKSPAALDEAKNDIMRLLKLRGKEVPSTPPITEDECKDAYPYGSGFDWDSFTSPVDEVETEGCPPSLTSLPPLEPPY